MGPEDFVTVYTGEAAADGTALAQLTGGIVPAVPYGASSGVVLVRLEAANCTNRYDEQFGMGQCDDLISSGEESTRVPCKMFGPYGRYAGYCDLKCGFCIRSFAAEYWCGPLVALGCTAPLALNYDPAATADDGGCFYPDRSGEGKALLAGLVFADGPPAGWAAGADPCAGASWTGVTCAGGRVTTVDLHGREAGTSAWRSALGPLALGASLGNLTALQTLSLSDTRLSGTLPGWLGNLTAVRRLDLHGTWLSGTLPGSLANLTALQNLYLLGTQISGTLPSYVGNFTALEGLDLPGTRLSGTLPGSLGRLAALDWLRLYATRLSGTLPAGLCAATLDLHGCALSGSVALGGCDRLRLLDLSNNSLTTLPTTLPPGLTHLYLGSNPIRASAANLATMLVSEPLVSGLYGLAALDVAFLGLEVDLRYTEVTAPAGCRLGPGPPLCAFKLQLVDSHDQAVKVGGLKPGLALGRGGLRAPMEDLGDGRYRAAVPVGWAPNTTGSLTVRFLDGAAEFHPGHDDAGTYVGYDALCTVAYGAAACPSGSHMVPDPTTGAACVCAGGYARDAANASVAAGCYRVRAVGGGPPPLPPLESRAPC
jgi:hypothetical protein